MANQVEARAKKKAASVTGTLRAVEKEALARIKPVTLAAEEGLRQAEAVVERIRQERPDQKFLKRADKWWGKVGKDFAAFQRRVIEGAGLASQAQLRELSRDIARLSKKLDGATTR